MNNQVLTEDSTKLLKECDAGIKMAVKNLDDISEHIKDGHFRSIVADSRKKHIELKNEIEEKLKDYGEEEKEPNIMASGMAFVKTNMKIAMEESDQTAADLLTDGCNMGIKSLIKYLNKHQEAEDEIKFICGRLVKIEEDLVCDIRPYL